MKYTTKHNKTAWCTFVVPLQLKLTLCHSHKLCSKYIVIVKWFCALRLQPILMLISSDIHLLSWPFSSHPDTQGTLWHRAMAYMHQQCKTIYICIRCCEQMPQHDTKKHQGGCMLGVSGGVWVPSQNQASPTFCAKLNQTSLLVSQT